ncbi:histidine kinase [Kitasatospora sp. MAP5-34]|uniref:sensor histidine kinase n=1 Tax=Kitasatospora sp. MAP5-34 TaxID=3035102 RepID=UPI0024760EF7|nr:histidine kinase [Kitasatospora sp. MAP5-34]
MQRPKQPSAAQHVKFVRLLWRPQSRLHARAVDVALMLLAGLDAVLNFPPPRDWTFWVSLAAAAALPLRRRLPRTVLLLTLPGLFAGRALIAAMVAVYTVARTTRPVWQKTVAVLLVVVGDFIPWPISLFAKATASDILQWLIYAVLLGTGPAWLGLLTKTRRDLSERVAELAASRDQLAASRDQERALHEQAIVAKERARIAREMHDVVSHQAGLIAVQAGALEVTTKDPDVRKVAGTVRGLAVATLEELRSMILVLRAAGAGPTELAPQPRLADLPGLVATSEVDVSLRIDGADGRTLPEPVERAAYRTVQEALTNVRKHAPGALTSVTVQVGEDALQVSVRNGTPNVEAPQLVLPGGNHGIVGLRERATLLGGTLTAAPRSDGGFDVLLSVPLGSAGR